MGDVATDWPWFRDLVGASFKGHTIANLYTDEPTQDRPGARWGGPLAEAPADADTCVNRSLIRLGLNTY